MGKPAGAVPLAVAPCPSVEARAFIGAHHRHNRPPKLAMFSAKVIRTDTGETVGAATAHPPRSTALDDGWTVEISRVCTDGTPNVCSMLYGAMCRAAKALGYRLAITYTLQTEPGTSLRAAGFTVDRPDAGGQSTGWHERRDGKARYQHNLFGEAGYPTGPKTRWARRLSGAE